MKIPLDTFGIFIRSIGERTELLCKNACSLYIPDSNIHILRNYFPSYLVFQKMFQIAHEKKYSWYLGLDADTILRPDWMDVMQRNMSSVDDTNQYFRYHFFVKDRFVPDKIIQGNNLYNGVYTSQIIREYKKNIFLSKFGVFNKLLTKYSHFYIKPETTIRNRMTEKYGLNIYKFAAFIGWHGFEQYHKDTFYRWVVRANRNPHWDKKYFFLKNSSEHLSDTGDENDWVITTLGWNYGKNNKLHNIDGRMRAKFEKVIALNSIHEKQPLDTTLQEFYDERLK